MFRNDDVQAWSDMMSQIYPAGLAIIARDDVAQLLAIVPGSRQAPHVSMDGHLL